MSKPFKLSAALYGHSLDVRSIVTTAKDHIVSGSRDKTAKFWAPNGFNTGFSEVMTYRDQKNFVMSVLYLEATQEFPEGLVVTGGNDNVILVYRPGEPFASLSFKEHTNAVSCLTKGLAPNSFLSGSWDNTAKYWLLSAAAQVAKTTFSGHSAAVWSVLQLENGNIVTASADKTINIWSQDGQILKTLQGHTDCVRGLADFPELGRFVSVANDASVRVWLYSGEGIDTFYGHTNYVYSIARNKAGGEFSFVTSDEDRTVRYWVNGVNTETFKLPAQSVWTVACLNNGDIVTGSSDGVVRVFTQNEARFVSPDALKTYEEEVNAVVQQSQQEIGGVKVSDLPGREALYDPGKRAGQMKMIREPHGVVAYTWVEDGQNSHWEKVGDVLGGTDKDAQGKTVYEGKAYDYVFSVDVEDGKPPLKLPYNRGDDPYKAANEFLIKNALPADYLEQVVNFILQNCKEAASSLPTSATYVDPFVGSSRYVPGSTTANQSNFGSVNCDPFTGGSSYTTSASPSTQATSAGFNADPFTGASSYSTGGGRRVNNTTTSGNYFPQTSYKLFETGDPQVILNKLKEFNQKSGASLPDEYLEEAIKLCSIDGCGAESFDVLLKLLEWPDEILFPVLDVVRLAAKLERNNAKLCTKNEGFVIDKLKYCTSSVCRVANNTLVALRALSNLCAYRIGEDVIFEHKFDILENLTGLGALNKNTQVALATFLLNISVLTLKRSDELGLSILANVLPDIITKLEDAEAQFRAYVALGTLLNTGNQQEDLQVKVKVMENPQFIEKLSVHARTGQTDVEVKRKNCAAQVEEILLK